MTRVRVGGAPWRRALGAGVVALCGCAGEPERKPEPRPAPAQPAPAPAPAPSETAAPPPQQQPRIYVITTKPFPEEVLSILPGDLVAVELANGGRAQGWVNTIRSRELAITAEGTRIITRLTPEAVTSVKVVYRPPRLITPGDGAGRGREAWLETNYVRQVVEGIPPETWVGLLGRNIPLVVSRQFTISGWDHVEIQGDRHLFASVETPTTFQPGDELKLAAVVRGVEKLKTREVQLGDVYLLLHKRGERVSLVCSTDPLHPSDLDRASLVKFLAEEPVTLTVYRPAAPVTYVKIARLGRNAARAYMQRVELIPERAVFRQLRAARDPSLEKHEGQVKAIHDALGLKPDDSLRNAPLVMEMRVPTLHGSLFLLPFRKEFGLD